MALFNGLLGNATQVDLAAVQREYARILTPMKKLSGPTS